MATETSSTGRESDKFMLRLPEGMRDRLKESAQAKKRTLNAEIVARLTESLDMPDPRKVGLLDELQRIRENYLPDDSEGDFTVEIKVVTKPKDPAQKYMPSREHYDEVMSKANARSAKKK